MLAESRRCRVSEKLLAKSCEKVNKIKCRKKKRVFDGMQFNSQVKYYIVIFIDFCIFFSLLLDLRAKEMRIEILNSFVFVFFCGRDSI